MGEVRNRNILIGIVDNDPYALKVFGTLIERMSRQHEFRLQDRFHRIQQRFRQSEYLSDCL